MSQGPGKSVTIIPSDPIVAFVLGSLYLGKLVLKSVYITSALFELLTLANMESILESEDTEHGWKKIK